MLNCCDANNNFLKKKNLSFERLFNQLKDQGTQILKIMQFKRSYNSRNSCRKVVLQLLVSHFDTWVIAMSLYNLGFVKE